MTSALALQVDRRDLPIARRSACDSPVRRGTAAQIGIISLRRYGSRLPSAHNCRFAHRRNRKPSSTLGRSRRSTMKVDRYSHLSHKECE